MIEPVGFACHWGSDRSKTWSGSPLRLVDALSARREIVDLDVTLPRAAVLPLRLSSARRIDGHWRSDWRHSRIGLTLVERRLRSVTEAAATGPVVMVGDLGVVDRPFFVWQDLSFDLLLEHFGDQGVPHFRTLSRDDINRLRDRQQEIYARATGVLAMSEWLAKSVVAGGVPADRVHVVPPGSNTSGLDAPLPRRRDRLGWRLLFVGRDFDTKAGDQVVSAFSILRQRLGPRIRLTIAGPRKPPSAQLPEGVDFLGPVPSEAMVRLFDAHDLFVMPSRFEGFGIVFAEALSRGLPCIARRACAMPEIVDESGGRLIESEEPSELADTVVSALEDDDLFRRCAAAAQERRLFYSWERAAADIIRVLDRSPT